MQLLEDYITQTGTARRTVFHQLKAGKLLSKKVNGRTYILTPSLSLLKRGSEGEVAHQSPGTGQTVSKKQQKVLIESIKEKLDNIILHESEDKAQCVLKIEQIVKHWQSQGIVIKGYNAKSIYRKITKAKLNQLLTLAPLERKSRADKGQLRNRTVAKILESHILPLAASIYFQNAKANLKLTVDLMIEYAKCNEDFYEIASLSPHTLWKVLKREFDSLGMADKHQHLNHFNLWYNKNKTSNTGAFTDDIEFMDWILGDDNKRNVASAWVYNPQTRKKELKQIKSWNWIEAKTGRILSFLNTTHELTTDDVIKTLIEALQQSGFPNKGIIIDNGIGSSEGFKKFFERLNFSTEQINGTGNKIILKLSKPYHPQDKAPIERSFGWTKDEFDAFRNNFVGDNHKIEGRHTTQCLTPAEADYMFEDYDKQFRLYASGFYETRLRRRVINGKTVQISIREYFEKEMERHAIRPVPDRAIRYALQTEREFTYKGGAFSFNLNGFSSDYLPSDFLTTIPSSFAGRRFKLLYNPHQPTEVDLYSMETFQDKIDGLYVTAGSFVCPLKAVRGFNADKQKQVALHNKAMMKAAQNLSIALTPVNVLAAVNLPAGQAGENARLIDTPKLVQKEIKKIIVEEKPLEQIAVEAEKRVTQKLNLQQPVTLEELEQIINGEK